MTAKSNTHGPAENQMSTGFTLDGFPSVGAWVSYALGSESQRPAGVRGHPRPARRAAGRAEQLGHRVPARRLPGHRVQQHASGAEPGPPARHHCRRVHTAYSLSAGAIKIKELVGLCKAERMPAVAITDSGNLFGALEFATTCSAAGRAADHRLRDRARARRCEGGEPARPAQREPDRIVLLVQNEAGYRNLLRLVSHSYLDGERRAEPAIIARRPGRRRATGCSA